MAKLIGTTAGDWEHKNGEDYMDCLNRQDKLLSELEKKSDVIAFPIADGKALYKVESKTPLILSLIPYGDSYQIPEAHIRGLTLKDIEFMLGSKRKLQSMFREK